jgi:hypothetical protein
MSNAETMETMKATRRGEAWPLANHGIEGGFSGQD